MDNTTRRLSPDAAPDPATRAHDPLADYRVPEQGTQSLDEPRRDTYARPCLRCHTAMRMASLQSPQALRGLARLPEGGGSLRLVVGPRSSSCSAWVCPACGYAELVADDPLLLFG